MRQDKRLSELRLKCFAFITSYSGLTFVHDDPFVPAIYSTIQSVISNQNEVFLPHLINLTLNWTKSKVDKVFEFNSILLPFIFSNIGQDIPYTTLIKLLDLIQALFYSLESSSDLFKDFSLPMISALKIIYSRYSSDHQLDKVQRHDVISSITNIILFYLPLFTKFDLIKELSPFLLNSLTIIQQNLKHSSEELIFIILNFTNQLFPHLATFIRQNFDIF